MTLEPCAHQGRQPPCSDAIIEADLARVVIASGGPDREGRGQGPRAAARRRDRSDEFDIDPAEEVAAAARLLNQPFRKHGITGLPWSC